MDVDGAGSFGMTTEGLLEVNRGFLSTKYLVLSSLVLVFYDLLICLDQEVRISLSSMGSHRSYLHFFSIPSRLIIFGAENGRCQEYCILL